MVIDNLNNQIITHDQHNTKQALFFQFKDLLQVYNELTEANGDIKDPYSLQLKSFNINQKQGNINSK